MCKGSFDAVMLYHKHVAWVCTSHQAFLASLILLCKNKWSSEVASLPFAIIQQESIKGTIHLRIFSVPSVKLNIAHNSCKKLLKSEIIYSALSD